MATIERKDYKDGGYAIVGKGSHNDWFFSAPLPVVQREPFSRRSGQPRVIIEGVTVLPSNAGPNGWGLAIYYSPDPSLHFPGVSMNDVVVSGTNKDDYFTGGISLYNCWMTTMDHVILRGKLNDPKGLGLQIYNSKLLQANDCHFLFWEVGARVESHCEGIRFITPEFVACTDGLELNASNPKSVDIEWHGGHFNCYRRGIIARNVEQLHFSNITGYRHPASEEPIFVGIDLQNCRDVGINSCSFRDAKGPWAPGDHGIVVAGDSDVVTIIGNRSPAADMQLAYWDLTNYPSSVIIENNIGTVRRD